VHITEYVRASIVVTCTLQPLSIFCAADLLVHSAALHL